MAIVQQNTKGGQLYVNIPAAFVEAFGIEKGDIASFKFNDARELVLEFSKPAKKSK